MHLLEIVSHVIRPPPPLIPSPLFEPPFDQLAALIWYVSVLSLPTYICLWKFGLIAFCVISEARTHTHTQTNTHTHSPI